MHVPINRQLMSFESCSSILPWLFQGKG